MKKQKKELATTIAGTLEDKLTGPDSKAKKLMKAIKKTAKQLAEKVIKITVKQEKKAGKAKVEKDLIKPELKKAKTKSLVKSSELE